jgi:mono/diheme cytochrome c family protein
MKLLRWLVFLAIVGLAVFWFVTRPASLEAAVATALPEGDAARGEMVFTAAGCASCHTAPGAEAGDGAPVLAGGRAFPSDFGTFYAPNISTDPTHGIGGWSDADIARAITEGVSPKGAHYYPAFPYTAYAKAAPADIADLVAYLRSLPADATPNRAHDVGFPFNIRRSLGGWKLLFAGEGWAVPGELDTEAARGRYLAEALAHCGECHTPRNALGGLNGGLWLAGAPDPSGKGRIPNITPGGLDWSTADIAAYLESGFTPEFDSAGGHMVAVIENFAQLPAEDRAAVAAYLKAVPAVD